MTALVSQPGGRVYACTSNPARVHLLDTGLASTGSYTSAVADAGHEARWGAISWDADNPAGTRVELKTRSGDRPSPDESWSAWSPPYAVDKGSSIASPAGRYLQWKAELSRLKSDAAPLLRRVRVTMLPENRPPTVAGLTVLAPAAPSIDTRPPRTAGALPEAAPPVLPVSDKTAASRTPAPAVEPPKGSRWIKWNAVDPDGDVVTASLWLRQRTAAAAPFAPLATGLTSSPYALDDSKLAEGTYEIRIDVDDGATNGPAHGLRDTDTIVSFLVDHTPPRIEVRRPAGPGPDESSGPVEVAATDAAGTIARGDYAFDASAGPWTPLPCKDGICDTPVESFRLDLPDSAKSLDVTIRVTDSAGNSATIDVPARDRKQGK